MEIQSERTKLDENFDEIRAILKANGITLEMAMAKLLELKAQNDADQRAEAAEHAHRRDDGRGSVGD